MGGLHGALHRSIRLTLGPEELSVETRYRNGFRHVTVCAAAPLAYAFTPPFSAANPLQLLHIPAPQIETTSVSSPTSSSRPCCCCCRRLLTILLLLTLSRLGFGLAFQSYHHPRQAHQQLRGVLSLARRPITTTMSSGDSAKRASGKQGGPALNAWLRCVLNPLSF